MTMKKGAIVFMFEDDPSMPGRTIVALHSGDEKAGFEFSGVAGDCIMAVITSCTSYVNAVGREAARPIRITGDLSFEEAPIPVPEGPVN